MPFKIIYTESYNKRAARFFKQHPQLLKQYKKTLELLILNPSHPSLRMHKLKGRLKDLYSISINISYRIIIVFIIKENTIIPIDIGGHKEVY